MFSSSKHTGTWNLKTLHILCCLCSGRAKMAHRDPNHQDRCSMSMAPTAFEKLSNALQTACSRTSVRMLQADSCLPEVPCFMLCVGRPLQMLMFSSLAPTKKEPSKNSNR
mmetsp:Transcript_43104/g.130233  ORF Transcript_43104/g.130233 Transcript_43104/m.130233 type:complete len:110 (-) Transcript_43104:1269-1598(-)